MNDPWALLRRATAARIGLGHVGGSLPTRAVLDFQLAHAAARDAVLLPWDSATFSPEGWEVLRARSRATDRADYLRRPDHGRRLAEGTAFSEVAPHDLSLVVSNGLSSAAVERHAEALLAAIRGASEGLLLGPVVVVADARVAIGDEVGSQLGSPAIAVILGERPGLSSADSLGIYLTFGPRPGRTDAERNCLSNVRPDGLPLEVAAAKLTWLAREALRRRLTGIALKDEAPTNRPGGRLAVRS